jgi:2-desacetyl-2-hydroxyethyl bacteriochlorophyllide A dehydrogenase
MRAARWHGRGDIRVEDVPAPAPADDELLLDVLWCGICGTDLEEYRHGPVTIPRAPIVLGHEVVGRVGRAAADGSGPRVGAVVVPDVVVGCGRCWWCRRHQEGLCPELSVRGQTEDGGLAQVMAARAATCLVVPDGVPPDAAALVEPASVAVRALRKVDSLVGSRIAVVGAGTIGQLVVRFARALGAHPELVVDPDPRRRDRALRFGAARAMSPADASDAAAGETGEAGAGHDAVVECSGAGGALGLALKLVRRGGSVDMLQLVLAEKRLIGSAAHLWDEDSAPALALIAGGAVAVDDLISRRVPLEGVVRDGFGAWDTPDNDVLKVLVDCR